MKNLISKKIFVFFSFAVFSQMFVFAQSGWTTLSSGITYQLNSVYFTDNNTSYAVGQYGIIKTINAGTNWTQASGITTYFSSVYFTDANTGYTVGVPGIILKTTNAGIDWTPQTSGTIENLNSVYFTNVDSGYIVGNYGKILKTTNGGINWTSQISGTTYVLKSVYFTDNNNGYAVGTVGTVLKTTNAGVNWTTQTSGTTCNLYSVCFTDSIIGYAAGGWFNGTSYEGIIIKTTDAGTNWITQTSGISGELNSVYFSDVNTGFVVGWPGTILKTTNAGNNWTIQTSGVTNNLNSVYFTDANTGYAVGNNGTILKTTTGGEPCLLSIINGTVYNSGGAIPTNSATMELYKRINITDFNRVDTIALTGMSFQFSNVESGEYRIRVRIDNNSFNPLVLNTYYDSVSVWNLADTLNVSCDSIYNIDIHLYEITPPIGAPTGSISGTIHYYSGAKGINAVKSPLEMGNPVTGGEIYIRLEPDDQPIANTETDTSGFYFFEGLPEGNTYSIAVDIPGLPMISTYTFSVTVGDTVFNNLNFYVDTSVTNGYITTDTLTRIFLQNINSDFSILVYPNPSQNNFSVYYSLNKTQKVNVELYDIVGKKIETLVNVEQNAGNYNYILNNTKHSFLKGIYFLKFSVDKTVYLKKVIIE